MWAAFGGGSGLTRVLTDFYDRVFVDERLAPFFRFTTKRRAIEKQYSFLQEIFTGEECYFGDRPYNAHHWMVISAELFDHREELMAACLRREGLPEHLVERFRRVDEIFRRQIVKSEAKPRKLRGESLPLEGFESLTLSCGALCDGCGQPVDAGTEVRYHVRTGRTFCPACSAAEEGVLP
jgi:truncated hemoglobin YjbI